MRNRILPIAGIALGVIALLALTGYAFANAPEKGSMGVWGYVASAKTAAIDVNAEQFGTGTIVVRRVAAPGEAWIVVHTDDDGMPGERVGLKHISKGVSSDVVVPLTGVTSDKVIVAVHADKAMADSFDFDMDKKEQSPDRPYFVNEKELATIVSVR